MTYLIVTEDLSAGSALAECIKARIPNSFSFPILPCAVENALNTAKVDGAICPSSLAEEMSLRHFPHLAVWPPETDAQAMAESLLSHSV